MWMEEWNGVGESEWMRVDGRVEWSWGSEWMRVRDEWKNGWEVWEWMRSVWGRKESGSVLTLSQQLGSRRTEYHARHG